MYWIWDSEERSTERSKVRVVANSIDAWGLGKIPSSPSIWALALYITSEIWENSVLPPYVGSGTWKNSERSLETRLERHEI